MEAHYGSIRQCWGIIIIFVFVFVFVFFFVFFFFFFFLLGSFIMFGPFLRVLKSYHSLKEDWRVSKFSFVTFFSSNPQS
jgi:hypothetical protein